ncbi:MAG: SUMF1/EgtB/PvdO family nonheme iron enzyme [Polyangiales bacterium]
MPFSEGTFAMGSVGVLDAEPVQESITVGAFSLDSHEVTIARFRRFWDAGHPAPATDVRYPGGRTVVWRGPVVEPRSNTECSWTRAPGRLEHHPIECVEWATAMAFCVWDGGRLPTEAEWEYAARGSRDRPVPRSAPWGDEPATCARAQIGTCTGDDGEGTRRVGGRESFGGVFDLEGNVVEWVTDRFDPFGRRGLCWRDLPQINPVCDLSAGSRSARGTMYQNLPSMAVSARRVVITEPTLEALGFRCARAR